MLFISTLITAITGLHVVKKNHTYVFFIYSYMKIISIFLTLIKINMTDFLDRNVPIVKITFTCILFVYCIGGLS